MLRNRFLIPLIWMAKQTEANGKPVQVIYQGTFHLTDRDQVIEITEDMIDEMVANFAAVDGPDRLPISVNHSSRAEKLETARAVGWVVSLAKEKTKDQVSLMASPRWLEDTLEAIRNEEFKYISAEIVFKDADRTTGEAIGCHLVGLAITNIPAIPDLQPIALSVSDQVTRMAFTMERLSRKIELQKKSMMEHFRAVVDSFYRAYPNTNETYRDVVDVWPDELVIMASGAEGDRYFKLGYRMDKDGGCTFDSQDQWVEVERKYVPVGQKDVAAIQGERASDVSANQNGVTGVGAAPQTLKKEEGMDEQKIRELLGLAPDADLMQALTELKDMKPAMDQMRTAMEAMQTAMDTMKADMEATRAAKGAADTALSAKEQEVVTLTTKVETADTEKVELTQRVEVLEAEKAEKDAGALRQKALADRKVTPAELAAKDNRLAKLALEQPGLFADIMEARTPYDADLFIEISKAATDDAPASDMDGFWSAVDAYHETNPNTKPAVARAAVLAVHPEFAKLFQA